MGDGEVPKQWRFPRCTGLRTRNTTGGTELVPTSLTERGTTSFSFERPNVREKKKQKKYTFRVSRVQRPAARLKLVPGSTDQTIVKQKANERKKQPGDCSDF